MYTKLLAVLPLLLAPVVESLSTPVDIRSDAKAGNRRLVRRVVRRGADTKCTNETVVVPDQKEHGYKPSTTKTRPWWKPKPTGGWWGDNGDDDDDDEDDNEDEDDDDEGDEDEDEEPSSTTSGGASPTASSSSSSTKVWWTPETSPWWTPETTASASSTSSSCSTSATASPSPTSSSDSSSSSSSPSSTSSGKAPESTSDWKLVKKIAGGEFFDSDHWWFWSFDDPTHGDVHYVDAPTAWNDGLVSINDKGHALMKVDTTQYREKGKRKSIRIHGTHIFTGGMVLMDAVHMPVGCGTWPAWWQNGPNWPHGGEIDILEGVNDNTQNQVSLHTGPGCTMPKDFEKGQTGILHHGNYDFDAFNCGSAATFNQGCGVLDRSSDASYGEAFNNANGGVYALVWADYAIQIYFFKRSDIPQDITDGSPDPSKWGTPVGNFPMETCDPYSAFWDNFNIFDTTLCGDWAGSQGAWSSCAAKTGYATCSEYVANNGDKFHDAYWEVVSVTYYNSTSIYP